MNWLLIVGMIVLAIAAQLFDVCTTMRNLSGTGGVEYNPIVKWSLDHLGSIWSIKLIFVGVVLAAWVISQEAMIVSLEIFALFGLAAGWLNTRHWNV